MARSPVLPVLWVSTSPGSLAIPLIGLVVGVAHEFLPLPQILSGTLAHNLSAITLVLDAWIGNEAASAMSTSELPHGFSPQETINSPNLAEESE